MGPKLLCVIYHTELENADERQVHKRKDERRRKERNFQSKSDYIVTLRYV